MTHNAPAPNFGHEPSLGPTNFSNPPKPRRVRKGWFLLALIAIMIFIVGQFSAPYVIYQPGTVFNTLGNVETEQGPHPLITISGAEEYPTDGELNLLTI